MAENIKVNIKMIKNMVTGNFIGLMVVNIKEIGLMENSMEEEYIYHQLEKLNKVNGKMGKELNGYLQYKIIQVNDLINI